MALGGTGVKVGVSLGGGTVGMGDAVALGAGVSVLVAGGVPEGGCALPRTHA